MNERKARARFIDAVEKKQEDVIRAFIECEFDIDVEDHDGAPILFKICKNCSQELINFVLESTDTWLGETIIYAYKKGEMEIIEKLIVSSKKLGENIIDVKAGDGYNLLMEASHNADIKVMQFCLDEGADVNSNFAGRSALMLAADSMSEEAVRLLLDNGANKYSHDWAGRSAYEYAHGIEEIIALLK